MPRRPGQVDHDPRERWAALGVLAVFWVAVVGKVLLLRAVVVGPGTPWGAGADIVFVTATLVLADLLFPDMRVRALWITDAILSVVMIAISMYTSYYGLLPTPDSLRMIMQATTVGSSVGTLVQPAYVAILADLPVFLLWGLVLRRRSRPALEVSGPGLPYVLQHRSVYLTLLPLGLLIVLGFQGILGLPTPIDGLAASRQRGLLTFLASSAVPRASATGFSTAFADGRAAQREIDRMRGGNAGVRIADFTPGTAGKRNVIIMQMESMQALLVGAKVGGVEVTPNLNRLAADSWYFSNAISQVGAGTSSDAEFIANTSLFPSQEGAAAIVYSDKELSSMPRVLRAAGYDAFTFHTNDVNYWNRSQLYPAIGFSRWFDRKYFGTSDVIDFGSSDMVLYAKTLQELERREKAGKPFYAQVMSMSAHYPFNGVPEAQRKLKLTQEFVGTTAGDYLVEQEYADRALGTFIEGLKRDGLWDTSIVVLYGDHFGLKDVAASGKEADALRGLLGRPYTSMDRMNIPLVIHVPGQTQGHVVTEPVGQVDIMPTIADPLGMDLSGTVHFGRDAFVRSPVLVPAGGFLPVGSYLDEKVLYVPGDTFAGGTAWRFDTHQPADLKLADKNTYAHTLEMLRFCDEYVRSLPKRADFDPSAKAVLPTGE
jgi:lipoteichoic acid synthase